MSLAVGGGSGIPGSIVEALVTGLLYPVLALLLVLLAGTLLDGGLACWDALMFSRRRGRAGVMFAAQDATRLLAAEGVDRSGERLAEVSRTQLWQRFSQGMRRLPSAEPALLVSLREETEAAATRAEDRSQRAARVGPALGLLAALLSLGMASGDAGAAAVWSHEVRVGIASLALGMLVWVVGSTTASVRRRQHERELADVAYILDSMLGLPPSSALAPGLAARTPFGEAILLIGVAAVVAALIGFTGSASTRAAGAADVASDGPTLDKVPIADSAGAGVVVGSLMRLPDGSVAWLPGQAGAVTAVAATSTGVAAAETETDTLEPAREEAPAAQSPAKAPAKVTVKEPQDTGSKSDATPEEANSDAVIADINVDDPNVDDPSVDGDLGE